MKHMTETTFKVLFRTFSYKVIRHWMLHIIKIKCQNYDILNHKYNIKSRSVKRLIAPKIKVCVYIIYVCVLCIIIYRIYIENNYTPYTHMYYIITNFYFGCN